jgi:hypothetical protein
VTEWREIPGFPGYEAGDDGFIRRPDGRLARKGSPSDSGYARVWLGEKCVRVHLAVLRAHRGEQPSPKHEGAHLNGDKSDNRLDNLEWKTRSENEADKRVVGTQPKGGAVRRVAPSVRGRVVAGVKRGLSISELARRFGVHRRTVAKWARKAA